MDPIGGARRSDASQLVNFDTPHKLVALEYHVTTVRVPHTTRNERTTTGYHLGLLTLSPPPSKTLVSLDNGVL